ncbi:MULTISPECIES: ANTAR domain-containing protein [Streptomyces]|uniref:ANTAR domain-containing protein n=1 Tax=Streptomyces TaxID=1883 RepID=UPI000CF269B0|nr:antitermination regulator [Streptomyces sp. 46]
MATMDVVADGDRMTVTMWGELDLGSRRLLPELYDMLALSGGGIDLCLDAVGFCDCAGLNALLDLHARAVDQGKSVIVRSCGVAVERVLDLTGTRETLTDSGRPDDDAPPALSGTAPSGTAPSATTPSGTAPSATTPSGTAPSGTAPSGTAPPEEDGKDLRAEVAQLRRAMQTRPTIDLARGILMASFGLTPEAAWSVLVRTSQNTNTKLHDLARDLVGTVRGTTLPEQVQRQLGAAIADTDRRDEVGAYPTGGPAEQRD